MNTTPETYLGILSFLSFGISIIAAVLAIDMYALLRTGQYGRTWRLLIIASVLFVLFQVLQMVHVLRGSLEAYRLSQVVELVFVITLAYAFYRQRQLFSCNLKRTFNTNDKTTDEEQDEDVEREDEIAE